MVKIPSIYAYLIMLYFLSHSIEVRDEAKCIRLFLITWF